MLWTCYRTEILKSKLGRIVLNFLENDFKGEIVINIIPSIERFDSKSKVFYNGLFKDNKGTAIRMNGEITSMELIQGTISYYWLAENFNILAVIEELCHAYDAATDYMNYRSMVENGVNKDYSEKPAEKSAKKKSKRYI